MNGLIKMYRNFLSCQKNSASKSCNIERTKPNKLVAISNCVFFDKNNPDLIKIQKKRIRTPLS